MPRSGLARLLADYRAVWLLLLYLANVLLIGGVCVVLVRYRVRGDIEDSWVSWLIGLADAHVALGVMFALLGPGSLSIRITFGILLTGLGILGNGVINGIDIGSTDSSVVQIMLASVFHIILLAAGTLMLARYRWVTVAKRWFETDEHPAGNIPHPPVGDEPAIVAEVLDANPSTTQPEGDQAFGEQIDWRRPTFGLAHVLLATTAIAFVLAFVRAFLPSIEWNEVDWSFALRISWFLWFDIVVLCLLPLAVVTIGLWEEGQAQLVVAAVAGIAICAIEVAVAAVTSPSRLALPADVMIALAFSRLLVLLANVSALRALGFTLQR